jgi:gliding motility-associated-like protein
MLPNTTRLPKLKDLAILLAFLPISLWATHNRAGEIHIEQIGPLTIRATIITWTKTSSSSVDRDSLDICWGDGSPCEVVFRSNGDGVPQPNDVKYNTYIAIHTYAGQATYVVSMTDLNRIAGIINVNPPTSDLVPFHIETSFTFQSVQFGVMNTTPYLLQPPIDRACVGKPFKHNPNAFDPDGDSISYQLIVPLQFVNEQVPNYSFPNQVSPGPNNILQLNPVTGDLIWLTPQVAGDYNIAFYIISWRKGVPIDSTIRDMQIFVSKCDNNPPEVTTMDKFCVVAGQTVAFKVSANDIDSADQIMLTALGGPLSSPYSPATFTVPMGWKDPVLEGEFKWTTDCEHISNQPYVVVFKATDTISPSVPKLSDLKSVSIKVVGPAPEDVQANNGNGEVEITWAKPYFCEATDNNYFYGFSVWRREGSNPFVPDTCAPGLAGKGYTELIFVTRTVKDGRYYFKDTNVQPGRTYCYRVLAKFARSTSGGSPYNIVEGLASPEVCVQLPRQLPVITNASVETTSNTAGNIKVCWSKPLAPDLDTILNPGPYRYQVLRGNGFSGGTVEIPGASFTAPSFYLANDTCFTDTGLNTADGPFHYQVAFYVNGNTIPLGSTLEASTVFLNVAASDKKTILSWQEKVPWGNYEYEVYRLNNATNVFDLIAKTASGRYEDRNLNNGQTYCYKIRSVGSYGVDGILSPLYNWSEEECGEPIDTVPPCAPKLTITNRCTLGDVVIAPDPPYENVLTWTSPANECPDNSDLVGYKIWFTPNTTTPFTLLKTINDKNILSFTHELAGFLAGCYVVTAFDSTGNESPRTDSICVVNCAFYELPNAFTPNGDGSNDVFEPFPGWRFVDRVDMQIFNRWGNLVFETTDPAIQWKGIQSDGKTVADGTYFYICRVYIPTLDGVSFEFSTLKGWIEVLQNGR